MVSSLLKIGFETYNNLNLECKLFIIFYNGEFDSGSERTLAARLKHASRTGSLMLALG